ncbi:sericin-2-like [Protopterus annectens]|uniref:sericin-2-like n=1 Tax=Protopterus annectens TaxID=7888 RepID=UPI001CFBB519|nr:sericin-2-like [Protopterus annectens]
MFEVVILRLCNIVSSGSSSSSNSSSRINSCRISSSNSNTSNNSSSNNSRSSSSITGRSSRSSSSSSSGSSSSNSSNRSSSGSGSGCSNSNSCSRSKNSSKSSSRSSSSSTSRRGDPDSESVRLLPPDVRASSDSDDNGGQTETQPGSVEVVSDTKVDVQPSPEISSDTASRLTPTDSSVPLDIGQGYGSSTQSGLYSCRGAGNIGQPGAAVQPALFQGQPAPA